MSNQRHCSNCDASHGPLKRYMWNINHNFDFKEERLGKETQRKGKPVLKSESGLLCNACAMRKGAWQTQGQLPEMEEELITIGTPEDAARVAQSLTDEDIERLEREEKYSSLN